MSDKRFARIIKMGILKLHNCTAYRLKYWRVIAFARHNYVLPGQVGEYKWGATYTLKAEAEGKGGSQGSRAAVNPNGNYYAYFVDGKIHIYSEEQFKSCSHNADNPNVSVWRPSDKRTDEFKVEWRQMLSRHNTSDIDIDVEWKEGVGFKKAESESTTVRTSNTTSVNVGAKFEASIVAKVARGVGFHAPPFSECWFWVNHDDDGKTLLSLRLSPRSHTHGCVGVVGSLSGLSRRYCRKKSISRRTRCVGSALLCCPLPSRR